MVFPSSESIQRRSSSSAVEPLENFELDYDFNFITLAQWGPRKNFDNTVKWFIEEFKDEEVGLIVKTNIAKDSHIDRLHTENKLRALVEGYKDRKCKIYLLHGTLSEGHMTTLYTHDKIKAMVCLSHGEGYGLPLFEAAYNGMPLIAINWSGQSDFLNAPNKQGKIRPLISKVQYHLQPVQKEAVWNGVIQEDSMWAFPTESSSKSAMRDVYKNYNRFKSQAERLQKWINKNFTEEEMYSAFVDSIYPREQREAIVREIDDLLTDLL